MNLNHKLSTNSLMELNILFFLGEMEAIIYMWVRKLRWFKGLDLKNNPNPDEFGFCRSYLL